MATKANLTDRYMEVSPSTSVDFNYQPGIGLSGPFRFALDGQVIKTLIGSAGLQELTDPNAMSVTALTPTLMPTLQLNAPSTTTVMPCAKPCPDGTAGCWPKFEVMRVQIAVQAKSKNDDTVKRSLSSTVRLRNDRVVFSSPTLMCPV